MKPLIFGKKKPGIDYHLRKSVYAVITDEAGCRILVIRTPIGHFLPGGGIEDEESHEDCLTREMLEETGYDIEIGDSLGNAQRYFVRKNLKQPMLSDAHFYKATLTDKAQPPTEKSHEMVWMTPDELRTHLFHEHHVWGALQLFPTKED